MLLLFLNFTIIIIIIITSNFLLLFIHSNNIFKKLHRKKNPKLK